MNDSKRNFWLTPNGLAAIGLIGAVLYFLLTEHRAHFISGLPFLILLLCPVMHIFMHRGHGGHGDHQLGFLLQWPTLLTVIMFPILVYVYVRLARHEEQMALQEFGDRYRQYMARTPAFIPSRRNAGETSAG